MLEQFQKHKAGFLLFGDLGVLMQMRQGLCSSVLNYQ